MRRSRRDRKRHNRTNTGPVGDDEHTLSPIDCFPTEARSGFFVFVHARVQSGASMPDDRDQLQNSATSSAQRLVSDLSAYLNDLDAARYPSGVKFVTDALTSAQKLVATLQSNSKPSSGNPSS